MPTKWAGEMATCIKSPDPNHMASVSNDGFFNRPRNSDWECGIKGDAAVATATIGKLKMEECSVPRPSGIRLSVCQTRQEIFLVSAIAGDM
ncbi:hypothetical protein B9Z19DRAFT_1121870 [Tuber borchii]|uniref:Uncharacterized protein n=1 Tax=Tuber borchii TaxID=42251 RepID=A0A2T7A1W4_TUBBO|nr:hypothetical protein B9Z19DRAFT_1121870 [Tuber borchii]